MKILHKKIGGFTLVELMVTISVIGILSTIVYANFGSARASARDDIRKTDLTSLQLAIELYKAQNGEYPDRCPSGNGTWSGAVPTGDYQCDSGNEYIVDLVPDFIAELPIDPRHTSNPANRGYLYTVTTVGGVNTEYKLMAFDVVEVKLITNYNQEFARCPSGGTTYCPAVLTDAVRKTYAVYKGSLSGL